MATEHGDTGWRLPAGLNAEQTRTNLTTLNRSMCLRKVFEATCASGTFIFVAFALSLGIEKERIGLFTPLVSMACILELLGIAIISRTRHKKRFVIALLLAEPFVLIAAVLALPFTSPAWRLPVLGLAVFSAAAALHLMQPIMEEWLASSIPAGLRSRFIGRRTQLLNAVMMATTLGLGFGTQYIPIGDSLGLAFLLIAGGIFGVAAAFALRPARLPTVTAATHVTGRELLAVARHKPFVRFLLAMLLYNLPFFLVTPYLQVFNLEILHLPGITVGVLVCLVYTTKMIAPYYLVPLVERYGPRRAILLGAPLHFLYFLCFPLCVIAGPWPMFAAAILSGIAESVFGIAQSTALYGLLPSNGSRPAFFAVTQLVLLSASAVIALAAVAFLELLKSTQVTLGSFILGPFHLLFVVTSLLFLPCLSGLCLMTDGRERCNGRN